MALVRLLLGILLAAVFGLWLGTSLALPQEVTPPLQLEATIPLGDVHGRIDHMAIDLPRRRLFVAELGNDSVAVVDLDRRAVVRTITKLKEPQGVAYLADADLLYVACAGDGAVHVFQGTDYAPIGRIALGADADNIRLEAATGRVFVGYGTGALAVLDSTSQQKIGNLPLGAHPESFQLDEQTPRIFVNLPNAHAIAVLDPVTGRHLASWPTHDLTSNFAMALHRDRQRVLVAFRHPAKLRVFSMSDGAVVASTEICGDADDVFVDPKRQRAYVSCGDGAVDVLDTSSPTYVRTARIPTVRGARTSLFVPELDVLFVAARAGAGQPPAIWVFRPAS